MSAETLISGGVSVMDGHCWGPSPMLIQDLASSPRAHSFWMEHLDRGDIYHIKFRGNLKKTRKLDCMCPRTSMFLRREVLWRDLETHSLSHHTARWLRTGVQGQRFTIKVRRGESFVAGLTRSRCRVSCSAARKFMRCSSSLMPHSHLSCQFFWLNTRDYLTLGYTCCYGNHSHRR